MSLKEIFGDIAAGYGSGMIDKIGYGTYPWSNQDGQVLVLDPRRFENLEV